jgi:branched-chain amino acid transport system substrate-binding protein
MKTRINERDVARIGFHVSGPDPYDVTGYCAAEMAIESKASAAGLPFAVQLLPIIDERDEETARQKAEEFVNLSGAIGVLGPLWSDGALATQDIYHAAGMAQLTSEASSPLLTSKGYRNFFRLVASDEYQGRALAKVAVRYLEAKRIAVLHDGSGWGRPIAEIFEAEAKSLGAEIVLFRGFGEQEQELDFDAMVQATLDARPDLVYFAVYWNKAHIIAHRLRDRKLSATFLGSDALKPYAFLEVPSLDVVKPYHSLAGVDMRLKPSARGFFKEFATRYPTKLVAPQYAAEAYDCASLFIEALRRARSIDRTRVLEELQRIERFDGAIGQVQFDENGDLIDPEINLYQCEDGLRKYIGRIRDLVS